MGWHINLVKNTVVITEQLAKELFEKANDGRWDFGEPVTDSDILDRGVAFKDKDGTLKLYFDNDHMEHMDYLHDEDVQAVLKRHKVKGDVCFSSDDGDNAGSSWGYRFDGKGGMVELRGTRLFKEVKPKKKVVTKKPTKTAKKARTPKKGATPSKARKATKRSRVGTRSGARGKLAWVCVACREDPTCPGFPGTDIENHPGVKPYCNGCHTNEHLKKVRV
jgi:hypothetical protein